MIGSLDKNISMGPEGTDGQPEYKKIQDYIYRFADQIGMGNFSKVFKGTHQITNKQVAIKIIELATLTNLRLQQLLNSQTKILKMLHHPNIIGCEQILSSVRNCYIILEMCNGGDLERRLRKGGAFRERDVYQVGVDVYEGLKYLGRKGVVHRDLKVSNVFISNGVYKIADFGFAQISDTQFKDISVGSPIYMSPEGYINNIYGPRTDVWAFGVLLYELVQGKTPCHDCRTEAELKHRLMKQIDYNSFSAHVSVELKNLIIQCLDTNPSLRIKVSQIENTPWMKKAYSFVHENKNKQQKENILTITTQNYRKMSEDITNKNSIRPQTPKQLTTTTPITQESNIKNYLQKFNNLIRSSQRDDQDQHKRKHSTLDKTIRLSKVDSQDQKARDKEDGKIFYSPKNAIHKFLKTTGLQNSPSSKFESLTLGKNAYDQSHLMVYKKQHQTLKNQAGTKKQESNIVRLKNTWVEKHPSRENKNDLNKGEKNKVVEQLVEEEDRKIAVSGGGNQDSTGKRLEKQALINEYKNYLSLNNSNKFKNNPKATPKTLQQTQPQPQKPILDQPQPPKPQTSTPNPPTKTPLRIITRKPKFPDCIGLIHYCRLCYKFACLLDQTGQADKTKQFLTAWSTQLLQELTCKIEEADIMFNNQSCLIGNFSTNVVAEVEKKKKLKDVTEEYLGKYNRALKGIERAQISLKQASNYIYNLYIVKGHEFKQKTKEKKSSLYFALICYISVLDRQTRNLMQFVYEIKPSMECRQVQKLLNVKISQFTQKIVQDIVSQGCQG